MRYNSSLCALMQARCRRIHSHPTSEAALTAAAASEGAAPASTRFSASATCPKLSAPVWPCLPSCSCQA